ncbi:cytochrome P450 family protein [Ceratobasidium sp. AG-Ba]|nr:cytochrome P450 family protein [Ceratobasidium sp. AG-Ba]
MTPCILFAAACAIAAVTLFFRSTRNRQVSPPKLPGHWLFKNQQLFRNDWRAQVLTEDYVPKYGDIFQISTFYRKTIVLNSLQVVTEVLEKQAAVTSDRPQNIMLSDLLGMKSSVGIRNHDEVHKKHRRVMASALNTTVARSYADHHSSTTAFFLRDLLDRTGALSNGGHTVRAPNHFASLAASADDAVGRFIMHMTYGHIVLENDPFVKANKQIGEIIGEAMAGRFWVDHLPILRYVPVWCPGAKFKRIANHFRETISRVASEPFEAVLRDMREGKVERPSYTSKLLELNGGVKSKEEDLKLVKETAEPIFRAGVGTTSALVQNFLFWMSVYPEVAVRVQAEIDTQVGRDRLPTLQDREALPYTNAVLQEVMRYSPVTPLGVEHCASADFEVGGYTINKGTAIEANIWALMHDPATYPDPHTFNPDRFLKEKPDLDPRRIFFGFGRRICPGQHVAHNGAFTMCTAFMSVFNITAGEGTKAEVKRHGKQVWKMFRSSIPAEPKPYECTIELRDQAARVVLEACKEAEVFR